MDNYHEDVIVVLEEIKLHHLKEISNINGATMHLFPQGGLIQYHKERAEFIQSEIDRLKVKYD